MHHKTENHEKWIFLISSLYTSHNTFLSLFPCQRFLQTGSYNKFSCFLCIIRMFLFRNKKCFSLNEMYKTTKQEYISPLTSEILNINLRVDCPGSSIGASVRNLWRIVAIRQPTADFSYFQRSWISSMLSIV